MYPIEQFRHCPRCGETCPSAPGRNPLECPACGFAFFFNPCVAGAIFVFDAQGRVLFIRRAKEPRAGRLAVPGGFIDVGETAEEGARRETREEVGLEIDTLQYVGSWTNNYSYRGVVYPVVDLIFAGATATPESAQSLDSVAGIEWKRLTEVEPEELAFPSLVQGREELLKWGTHPGKHLT